LPSASGRQRAAADVRRQLGQRRLFAVCWQMAKRPNRPAQVAQAAATWPLCRLLADGKPICRLLADGKVAILPLFFSVFS